MNARSVVSASSCFLLALQLGCESPRLECDSGYCGTLVVVTGAEVGTLLPPMITDFTDLALADLIFQPLADIGSGLNTTDHLTFSPRLAQSWDFEDPLTLVFEIHPDAKWHDGQPLTAHDVAFTYSVYTNPEGPYTSFLESIESVTARDDHTAVFRFNRQHREQFYAATYHMRILPRHILESVPRDSLRGHRFGANPIGSGPYRFVRRNAGVSIEIEADTNFYEGRPGIPRMVWRFGSDPNTRMTLLLSEEADMLSVIPGPENVALAQAQEQVNVISYPANYYGTIVFNLADPENPTRPHPVLGDSIVRRAIAMAVDRDQVAQTVLGDSARAPTYPLTAISRIYQEDGFELPFDPDAARALLDAANYRDTNGDGTRDRNGQELEFRMIYPAGSQPRATATAVIASLLGEIGIVAIPNGIDNGVFRNQQSNGTFDAFLTTWYLQPSPTGIPGIWGSDGAQNYSSYSNPTVDSLFALAMNESDPEREMAYWGEAFDTMNRDPGALWIYRPANYAAIHSRFENVRFRPDRWGATMWLWRVRDGEWIVRDLEPLP
jgi:peptide/nickel transport system substrate-binding protein